MMNTGREDRPYPGQLSAIDGFKLHWLTAGEGGPTVVLEAAVGDFCLTWSLVRPEVGRFTRTVAYDRAGLGWSEISPEPRTGEVMVRELRQLLATANIPGPYLIVGHSFSGLLVRLFAHTYPQDVAGMVLLDPSHEDQFQRFPEPIRQAFGPLRDGQLALLRQNAETVRQQGPQSATLVAFPPPTFPSQTAEAYQRQSVADPSRLETMAQELENLELTQQQVRDRRSLGLGEIPLTVISHGRAQAIPGMTDEINQAYEALWQEMQIEIGGLSSRGKRLVVQESGHNIHHDQPQLVIQEIQKIVEAYRLGKG